MTARAPAPRTRFLMVPLWLMREPEVRSSATLLRVYVALLEEADYSNRITRTHPSKIQAATGLSRSTVYRDLATLRALGAIGERPDGSLSLPLDDPLESTRVDDLSTPVDSESTTVDGAINSREGEILQTRVRPPAPSDALVADFEAWWAVYPRHVAKPEARGAFTRAVKRATVEAILAGVRRFAADPNLPPETFIPHPATWLNQDRWEDGPLPPRDGPRAAPARSGPPPLRPGGPGAVLPREVEGPSGRLEL